MTIPGAYETFSSPDIHVPVVIRKETQAHTRRKTVIIAATIFSTALGLTGFITTWQAVYENCNHVPPIPNCGIERLSIPLAISSFVCVISLLAGRQMWIINQIRYNLRFNRQNIDVL